MSQRFLIVLLIVILILFPCLLGLRSAQQPCEIRKVTGHGGAGRASKRKQTAQTKAYGTGAGGGGVPPPPTGGSGSPPPA